jgi:hypothetical protein
MISLTPKENYLRALRHEETEYVPVTGLDHATLGCPDGIEIPFATGDRDAFGVRWVDPGTAGGGMLPAPGEFLLEDVRDWKKKVVMPDLERYDWEKLAAQCAGVDRSRLALNYYLTNGVYERLGAVMGFEAALIAMAEEPEAVNDFFTAVTDHKIKMAEKIVRHIQPDVITYFDDFATEQNLFMSPETYRTLIKPHHKRFFNVCRDIGVIPVQHVCGRAEDVIDDLVEAGSAGWNSIQSRNNLHFLLDAYGDKFVFEGGFDSNGPAAQPGASAELIEAEVKRCYDEFGGKKGYTFAGFIIAATNDPAIKMAAIKPMFDACLKLRSQGR